MTRVRVWLSLSLAGLALNVFGCAKGVPKSRELPEATAASRGRASPSSALPARVTHAPEATCATASSTPAPRLAPAELETEAAAASASSASFSLPALPSDSQWLPFTSTSNIASSAPPAVWRTTLRPRPRAPFVVVEVAAVDLTQLALSWVVGAGDTGAERLASFMSPGLIAPNDASEVVAIFNGGFLARHGWWGQISHGQTLVPAKAGGCGVAMFNDGHVNLGPFSLFEHEAALISYRQTPPCLIRDGQLHPQLVRGDDRVWAGKNEALKTRRRSALGISKDGTAIYYLVGTESEPLDLARALGLLGAETGLQLDINWNWTRFFLVGRTEQGRPAAKEALLDGMAHDYGEYFTRASQRDFFVLRRR